MLPPSDPVPEPPRYARRESSVTPVAQLIDSGIDLTHIPKLITRFPLTTPKVGASDTVKLRNQIETAKE